MKQQLNSKCERWRLKLQQYKFTIRYIKGKHNIVADYLSRSPVDSGSNDEDDYTPTKSRAIQTEGTITVNFVAPVITRTRAKQQVNERINCHSVDQVSDAQQQQRNDDKQIVRSCDEQKQKRDDNIQLDHSCFTDLKQPQITGNINDSNRIIPFTWEQLKKIQHQDDETKYIISHITGFNEYFLKDDMLMKKSSSPVPFVPQGRIRSDIIKIYHDTPANGAHFGRNKTIQKIRRRYFWPNMIQDIRDYVKSCVPCLQNNHLRQKSPGALKPI